MRAFIFSHCCVVLCAHAAPVPTGGSAGSGRSVSMPDISDGAGGFEDTNDQQHREQFLQSGVNDGLSAPLQQRTQYRVKRRIRGVEAVDSGRLHHAVSTSAGGRATELMPGGSHQAESNPTEGNTHLARVALEIPSNQGTKRVRAVVSAVDLAQGSPKQLNRVPRSSDLQQLSLGDQIGTREEHIKRRPEIESHSILQSEPVRSAGSAALAESGSVQQIQTGLPSAATAGNTAGTNLRDEPGRVQSSPLAAFVDGATDSSNADPAGGSTRRLATTAPSRVPTNTPQASTGSDAMAEDVHNVQKTQDSKQMENVHQTQQPQALLDMQKTPDQVPESEPGDVLTRALNKLKVSAESSAQRRL